MTAVAFDRVTARYGDVVALDDLTLEAAPGELLVLVGPSGSGKSTALRVLAGLEQPTSGRVLLGDRDVTSVPPHERGVAMVFQDYALYPHLTVRRNLTFGATVRREKDVDTRVDVLLPAHGRAEGEVAPNAQVRVQRIVLKHHRHAPLMRRD